MMARLDFVVVDRLLVESSVSLSREGLADNIRHSQPPGVQPEGDIVNSRRLIEAMIANLSMTVGQGHCQMTSVGH